MEPSELDNFQSLVASLASYLAIDSTMAAPPRIILVGEKMPSKALKENLSLSTSRGPSLSWSTARKSRVKQSFIIFFYLTAFVFTIALCAFSIKRVEKSTTHSGNQIRAASPQDVGTAQASSLLIPKPTGVLNVFQVSSPVLGPQGIISNILPLDEEVNATANNPESAGNPATIGTQCSVILMEFTFANSFGKPFVGKIPISTQENRRGTDGNQETTPLQAVCKTQIP
jgi:hypothetical protein